jgi:hypothetical protein
MASLLRLKISHEDDVLIAGGCDLKWAAAPAA